MNIQTIDTLGVLPVAGQINMEKLFGYRFAATREMQTNEFDCWSCFPNSKFIPAPANSMKRRNQLLTWIRCAKSAGLFELRRHKMHMNYLWNECRQANGKGWIVSGVLCGMTRSHEF